MDDASGCRLRALATGRIGRVEQCPHGTVHITLGAITLRLTASQLEDLASTLEAAVVHLVPAEDAPQPRLLC